MPVPLSKTLVLLIPLYEYLPESLAPQCIARAGKIAGIANGTDQHSKEFCVRSGGKVRMEPSLAEHAGHGFRLGPADGRDLQIRLPTTGRDHQRIAIGFFDALAIRVLWRNGLRSRGRRRFRCCVCRHPTLTVVIGVALYWRGSRRRSGIPRHRVRLADRRSRRGIGSRTCLNCIVFGILFSRVTTDHVTGGEERSEQHRQNKEDTNDLFIAEQNLRFAFPILKHLLYRLYWNPESQGAGNVFLVVPAWGR